MASSVGEAKTASSAVTAVPAASMPMNPLKSFLAIDEAQNTEPFRQFLECNLMALLYSTDYGDKGLNEAGSCMHHHHVCSRHWSGV
jgi:hypothetical protein